MSKKTTTTTELETVKPMLPATAQDFAAYADDAANKVLDVERVMPVLQLLQTNSKALVKNHEKFVQGAAAGQFLNRATGFLADTVVFIPCARQHSYVEWVPIEKGGGKVGEFPIDDARITALRQQQGFGKLLTPEGNEIAETFYVFGYTLRENEKDPVPEPAVLAVKGMSITPYRQFFNGLRSYLLRDEAGNLIRSKDGQPINPPLFAHQLRITSMGKNKAGNDFLVFKFEHLNGTIATSMVPAAMLPFGKKIAEDVTHGRARVEEDQTDGATPGTTSAF